MTTAALSPSMTLSKAEDGSQMVLIEDTGALWGDAAWGAGYLWSDGLDESADVNDWVPRE